MGKKGGGKVKRKGIEEMTRPEFVKELRKKRMKGFSGLKVAQLRDMLKREVKSQMTLGGKWEMRKVGSKVGSKVGHGGAGWEGGQDNQGEVGNTNNVTDIVEEDIRVAGNSGEEAGREKGGTAACGDPGQKGDGGDQLKGDWG